MVDVFGELVAYLLRAIDLAVTVLVVGVVVLMVLRWALVKISPFGWASYQVRRLSDPLVWPLAQRLPMPNSTGVASLLVVLITFIGAYFFKQMARELLVSLLGLVAGISSGAFLLSLGWLLYGAVSVLLLLIVVRIVFSWMPFARDTRLMWTLYGLTEPVMAPFRQLIPPLGMFDLSPILLILLLGFVKSAIQSLLIR